jgi:regulatory protein
MKIKRIKQLKSGKYKIELDIGSITTYDDVIINNKLLYAKEIDSDMYELITHENIYYEAYNKTLYYVTRKIRSKKEVYEYLKKFELSYDMNKKIVTKLESIGLINDISYLKAYISDAIYLSNDGPDKIKQELLSQNINEELIDEELSKIDEDIIINKLSKLITKKIKSNHTHSSYQLKQKITIDLVNMGYKRSQIELLLENYDYNDSSLLEKEYNKLYIKLSKKYSDNELYNKIKQKLYAKGFDINDINALVEKEKND